MTVSQSPAEYGISQFEEVVKQLSIDQLRFVTARINCSTDKEAAETIGVSSDTVTYWKRKGAPIDDAVKLLAFDGAVLASEILRKSVAEAAAIKRRGLESPDEKIQQAASSDIMDRVMGRAAQPLTGAGGGPIETRDANSDAHNRALSTLAETLGAILSGPRSSGEGGVDASE